MSDTACEVKATVGDTHLGGSDFDNRILNYFLHEIKRKTGKDISRNKRATRRLTIACQRAKHILSKTKLVEVELDTLVDDADMYVSITRQIFEELNADLFTNMLTIIDRALKISKYTKDEINEVILVGGSTRIPKVRKIVSDFFNGKQLNQSLNLDEAVACGAAVQAAMLFHSKSFVGMKYLKVMDFSPLCSGADNANATMTTMTSKNTTAPGSVLPRTSFDSMEKLGDTTETALKIQLVKGDQNNDNWVLNVTAEDDSTAPKRITITNGKGEVSQWQKVENDLKSSTTEKNQNEETMDSENKLKDSAFNITTKTGDEASERNLTETEVLNIIQETKTVLTSVLQNTPESNVEQTQKLTDILNVLGLIDSRLQPQNDVESTENSELSETSEHSGLSDISERSEQLSNNDNIVEKNE